MIQQMHQVTRSGSQVRLNTAIRLDSFLPSDRVHFYRYQGSLTTPACLEVVFWTVFDSPLQISERQVFFVLFTKLNQNFSTSGLI